MKAVFHLSGVDVEEWREAIRTVRDLLADDSADVDDAVLLANGDAIWLFEAGSALSEQVRGLGSTDVRCVGCRRSLSERDIPKSDLLSNVDLVPSGAGELVRLQDDGYAYVKVP
ncbi:MAG: DsrE family protein [Haloquadratum sp.]